jgi:NTE family protein
MSADADPHSLVLGAGGRPGLAYHAGTLLALELHGVRTADACSITGTSAGAIVTGLLSVGAQVEDLASYSVGVAPRQEFKEMDTVMRAADRLALALDAAALLQLADVRRYLSFAGHLRARRVPAALASLVPGLIKISHRFAFLDSAVRGCGEPTLWRVVAADSRRRRHVFTAGQAKLSLAVAASCAVPGLFAPVAYEGRRLVDGGVHSTTNADLALEDGADTVVVLAPMCTRPTGDKRRAVSLADVTLAREKRELRAAGKRVVTFRPSPGLRRMMGWNPLSTSRSSAIVAGAFLEAADILAELGPPRRLDTPGVAAA